MFKVEEGNFELYNKIKLTVEKYFETCFKVTSFCKVKTKIEGT